MRGLRSTLILLGVLIGLGAYIYFVESRRPPASEAALAREKVFALERDQIEELRVTSSSGETTALRKTDAEWQVVEPLNMAADESIVGGITTNLANLEIQRVVEENASDLTPFGLGAPRVQISFRADDDLEQALEIGDKTATGGDLYAKVRGQNRVFLISGFLDGTFDRTTFDLQNKSVLRFDRDAVQSVEIAGGTRDMRFERRDFDWWMTEPWTVPGDGGAIDGLVGRLNTGQMRSIATGESGDLRPYGLDDPDITVTLAGGDTHAALAIGSETEDGARYARDLSRPLVFTVDRWFVEEFEKAPGDYRRKDIFDFRPFNATRVEIVRHGQTFVYERTVDGEDGTSRWRRVAPEPGDVDPTLMETALSRLANLRAESFAEDLAGTGLDAPLLTVTVAFDEGKAQDRVRIARADMDGYAAREGEPGAGRIASRNLDDLVSAVERLEGGEAADENAQTQSSDVQ